MPGPIPGSPEWRRLNSGESSDGYDITDSRSGKTYHWKGAQPPSKDEARQFIYDEEHKGVWDTLNEPLSDLPSRAAKAVARPISDYGANHSGILGSAARGGGALIESLGDIGDSFTSPVTGGLALLSGGAGLAEKAGLSSAAGLLGKANRVANAGLVGHGLYRAAEGNDTSDRLGGAVEAIGGGLGLRGSPAAAAEAEGAPKPGPFSFGKRRQLGAGRTIPGQPVPPIDAEFRVTGEGGVGGVPGKQGLPDLTDRGLPPARPTFYGGRYGVGNNIDEVQQPIRSFEAGPGEMGFKPRGWSAAQGKFRDIGKTGATEIDHPVFEDRVPNRDILEQNSPYGTQFARPGASGLEDFPAESQPPTRRPAIPTAGSPVSDRAPIAGSNNPFAKVSDGDIEFLASTGDKQAIEEARRRPALAQRVKQLFSDEGGWVGSNPFSKDKNMTPVIDQEGVHIGDAEPPVVPERTTPMEDSGQVALPRLPNVPMPEEVRTSPREIRTGKAAPVVPLETQIPTNVRENKSWLRDKLDQLKNDETGALNISWKDKKVTWGDNNEKSFSLGEKELPPKMKMFQSKFEDWVNARRATRVEGMLKERQFSDLKSKGIQGIFEFQHGVRSGKLSDVADYFDSKFAELNKGGVRLGYRENYLPQLWEDDPDKVFETYRRLGLKPSFSLERVLENYEAGIREGLKPRYKDIGELVGWYEGRANKALADRGFFDHLRETRQIMPKSMAPAHWETLDPDHFPVQKFKSKGREYQGALAAPPEIARAVNNYLRVPSSELDTRRPGAMLQWMADKASMSKNFAMSAGIPGTGINAHGLNIFARTVIANPADALKAGHYLFQPSAAKNYLDEALHTAPWAMKRGLTLTTEGHEMGVVGSTNLAGKMLQGFLKKQGQLFEDPLFQNIIPALKLKHFNDTVEELTKTGMGREAAGKAAAEFTNNMYGGINWEAMGRSRDLQNLARMLVLAPDWLQSNINLGKGMAKTMLDPKTPMGRQYAKAARNIIGAYMAADVVNYTSSGHHMWENAPGHALDVQLGKSGDKDRYVRPFGTAADFLRLPFDVGASAVKGDLGGGARIVKNRLSIPAATAGNLIWNEDSFGRPITGKDVYGRPIPTKKQVGGVVGELANTVMPPYVKSGIDLATGRANVEQALAGTTEMPLRYANPGKVIRPSRSRRGRK